MPRVKPQGSPSQNARGQSFRPRPQQAALPDRPGRTKMALRRFRRLLRPTLFVSVAVLALIVGSGAVRMIGHGGSMRERLGAATVDLGFDVQNIVVQGQEKTPKEVLFKALAVHQGDPILSVSLPDAKARLEHIAWIRAATVERVLPHTLRVVLDERRPFAVWQNKGNFALIDQAGNVVTDSDIAAFVPVLPVVVGEGAPTEAAKLLALYDKFPPLAGRMLAAIRVGQRRWDLCMTSGAIVQLPEGAEEPALGKLAELQTEKSLLDRPLQDIDLRLPDRLRMTPLTGTPCGHTPSPAESDATKPQTPARKPA
ncbi:MAG: cell division protein FtsQ/DivIB [Acetobacteraceae bacterium]|nr:cell division protein FtsQ/DivIB [Acetobacteraceae bacterium]